MNLKSEICDAVRALGYRGRIQYYMRGYGRAAVYVNNNLIGIYDFVRKTFVD